MRSTFMPPLGEARNGDPYGNRTRVTDVKGRCPRPLDEGTVYMVFKGTFLLFLAGVLGFEPRNAGVRVQCLTAWRHPKERSSF